MGLVKGDSGVSVCGFVGMDGGLVLPTSETTTALNVRQAHCLCRRTACPRCFRNRGISEQRDLVVAAGLASSCWRCWYGDLSVRYQEYQRRRSNSLIRGSL